MFSQLQGCSYHSSLSCSWANQPLRLRSWNNYYFIGRSLEDSQKFYNQNVIKYFYLFWIKKVNFIIHPFYSKFTALFLKPQVSNTCPQTLIILAGATKFMHGWEISLRMESVCVKWVPCRRYKIQAVLWNLPQSIESALRAIADICLGKKTASTYGVIHEHW